MRVNGLAKRQELNVPARERILSALAGGLLLANAFGRKKGVGILSAVAGGYLAYRACSGHCPAYSLVGRPKVSRPVKNLNIRVSLLINKPRKAVYAYWRNLENLPSFMSHLEQVIPIDETRSKWTARMPAGIGELSWEASIVKEEKDRFIGWQSLANSSIQNAGKVEFRDAGHNATEVIVVISYIAPLGIMGNVLFRFLNSGIEHTIKKDILSFKEHFERI